MILISPMLIEGERWERVKKISKEQYKPSNLITPALGFSATTAAYMTPSMILNSPKIRKDWNKVKDDPELRKLFIKDVLAPIQAAALIGTSIGGARGGSAGAAKAGYGKVGRIIGAGLGTVGAAPLIGLISPGKKKRKG